MNDANKIKQEITNQLDNEIESLKIKKSLIENLEIKPVTMDEWQKLCKTPLRHNSLLLDIAKATFPQGDSFCKGPNEVIFCIDDVRIFIPTCVSSSIRIDIGWYRETMQEPVLKYRAPAMKEYFKLLDSGNYTWYDLAKCRNRRIDNKLKLFIWWFTKAKWREDDRDKWESEFKQDEEYHLRKLEKYNHRKQIIEDNLATLQKIVPILTEYSEVKGYYKYDWLNGEELLKLK